jgi:hypothetical protein
VRVTVTGRFAGLMPRELLATPSFSGSRAIVSYHGGSELRRDRQRDAWGWTERAAYAPGQQSIGVPPAGRTVVFSTTIVEAGETIWEGDVEQAIVVDGAIDDVVRPVHSAELLAAMIDAVNARLRLDDECSRIVFVAPSNPSFAGITLGLVVELLHRETIMASAVLRRQSSTATKEQPYGQSPPQVSHGGGATSIPPPPPRYSGESWAVLSGDRAAVCAAELSDPDWSVRVRGDGATALDHYEATAYWSGTFTVPLAQIRQEPSQ